MGTHTRLIKTVVTVGLTVTALLVAGCSGVILDDDSRAPSAATR